MDAPVLAHQRVSRRFRTSVLTDIPPGVSCFVYLHPGGNDVGSIAEEWQPHVFNVEVVERLPYCPIELVTLINISTASVTTL